MNRKRERALVEKLNKKRVVQASRMIAMSKNPVVRIPVENAKKYRRGETYRHNGKDYYIILSDATFDTIWIEK